MEYEQELQQSFAGLPWYQISNIYHFKHLAFELSCLCKLQPKRFYSSHNAFVLPSWLDQEGGMDLFNGLLPLLQEHPCRHHSKKALQNHAERIRTNDVVFPSQNRHTVSASNPLTETVARQRRGYWREYSAQVPGDSFCLIASRKNISSTRSDASIS